MGGESAGEDPRLGMFPEDENPIRPAKARRGLARLGLDRPKGHGKASPSTAARQPYEETLSCNGEIGLIR